MDGDAAMSDPPDTRRSPRIPCDLPMEYQVHGAPPQDGRITDIGTGGALLTTQQAIPVGAQLILRFQLPLSDRLIHTSCTVKWADHGRIGVEFPGLSRWDQQEIWKYHAKESARQQKLGG